MATGPSSQFTSLVQDSASMDIEAKKTMFELATPWILILLPLPLFIWFSLPRVNLQLPVALRVPFFNAMTGIVEQEKHSLTKQAKLTFLVLLWSLLIFALAGPRWIGEPRPLEREGHNIMLTLDLSPSMAVNDMVLNQRNA